MATKVLSGTYSTGYSLAAGFDVLTVTATGTVRGVGGAISFPVGQSGGVGLTVAHTASIHNLGYIIGGDAGRGYGSGDDGGTGGAGLALSAGGYLINQSTISGGGGGGGGHGDAYGYIGGDGGSGGVGVDVSAGGYIVNSQLVRGGAGGAGGVGFMDLSGAGGAGGTAVALSGGGTLNNKGQIHGGAGAIGGQNDTYSGADGGVGGVAVKLTAGGSLYNSQIIAGGAGGDGAAGVTGGGNGGGGGAGVLLSAAAAVSNAYYITGGHGGAGGSAGGVGGAGGAGILLAAPSAVTNYGTLIGGTGGAGGSGGPDGPGGAGGAGVGMLAGGPLYNSGTILGGAGGANGGVGTAATGAGVTLSAGGTVINGAGDAPYALIQGGFGVYSGPGAPASIDNLATIVGTGAAGVELATGGTVINGFAAARYSAVIRGQIGVVGGLSGATTVVAHYGVIVGTTGVSVKFQNTASRLIVDAGAVFVGAAMGGGGTLELNGGSGTLTHLGGAGSVLGPVSVNFSGFGTYQLDAGTWALQGPGTLAAGTSLINGGALTVTGTVIDDGSVTNAAGSSLVLVNGALLEVQGGLVNAGGVTLTSAASFTQLRVLAGGMTLSGGGTVTLAGPRSRISGATTTSTLTNIDNTISGSGWLGLSKMTLNNKAEGVIEAVGKQALVINTKGETAVNAGLLESASGATLDLVSTTFDQSAGGTIAALAGGRVLLGDDVIVGGTLSQAGSSLFNVNASGGELDGSTHAVTLVGALRVLSGVSLTLDGTLHNTGKLETFGGAKSAELIVGPDGVMLTGAGQVMFNANAGNIIVGAAAGDILTNVDNRITGAGNIGDGSMVLVNRAAGQIVGNSAVTLTLDTGASKITNAGLIESAGTGQVLVKSAVVNSGTLYALNGTLTLGGAVTGSGIGEIRSGVLDLAGACGETVTFISGATGQLRLNDWIAFTGSVVGLSKTGANSLDLGLFTLSGAHASYNGTTTAGVLTVANGTQTAHIKLTGNYIGSTWTLSSDGHGGTKIVDPAAVFAQAAAAFAAPAAPLLAAPTSIGLSPQNTLIHG